MYKNIVFMIKPNNMHAKTLICKIRTNKSNHDISIQNELKKYWPHSYWSKDNHIGIISQFEEQIIEKSEKTFFDIYIDHVELEQYYLGKKL